MGTERLPKSAELRILEIIDLLNQTRHVFKSRQVERARHLLEELIAVKPKRAGELMAR